MVACNADDCSSCLVGKEVTCHFTGRQLARFYAIVLPSFILAVVGLSRVGVVAGLIWAVILIVFFIFVETRVLCSHCPHYAESSRVLRCWANYGIPKIWAYRPGPMNSAERIVFFSGLVCVWGFPLAAMTIHGLWLLLVLYIIATCAFFGLLAFLQCRRCINLACPLNRVPVAVRKEFIQRVS
jgi:hypothetical protein